MLRVAFVVAAGLLSAGAVAAAERVDVNGVAEGYVRLVLEVGPYDADEWVQMMNDAGMKYIIFTTKHHDGFVNLDSRYTDYKITSKDSPFGRDIVKELADACHRGGGEGDAAVRVLSGEQLDAVGAQTSALGRERAVEGLGPEFARHAIWRVARISHA